eukprot:scaffold6705_cov69-Phaeocystis_antarctica.AAC.1
MQSPPRTSTSTQIPRCVSCAARSQARLKSGRLSRTHRTAGGSRAQGGPCTHSSGESGAEAKKPQAKAVSQCARGRR